MLYIPLTLPILHGLFCPLFPLLPSMRNKLYINSCIEDEFRLPSVVCTLGFNENSVIAIGIEEENAVGGVALHIHQISVLDDFGSILKGMISHLLEPLAVEGNDFLHLNLHRFVTVGLVIQRSIECDFLHRHQLSFLIVWGK